MEKLRIAIPAGSDLSQNYPDALRALGAVPELVDAACDPADFDGLLLPGGGDLEPWRFGQENCGSRDMDAGLDALQFAVTEQFIRAEKPIFGICRGHQLLNVWFGGTLIQDLGEKNETHTRDHGQDRVHLCRTEPDSWLGRLYGMEYHTNSAHHQAVDRPGRGIRIISRSEDGVAEALVHETLPVYGVQWHPERMCFAHQRKDTADGSAALRFFLEICEKRKKE